MTAGIVPGCERDHGEEEEESLYRTTGGVEGGTYYVMAYQIPATTAPITYRGAMMEQ